MFPFSGVGSWSSFFPLKAAVKQKSNCTGSRSCVKRSRSAVGLQIFSPYVCGFFLFLLQVEERVVSSVLGV